jgi:hypothetical protein
MVMHAYNPNTQEVEVGLRVQAWAIVFFLIKKKKIPKTKINDLTFIVVKCLDDISIG